MVLPAIIAVALGTAATVGAGAAAKDGAKAANPTIKMKLDGKELSFAGPETIEPGADLKVKNATDPKELGPHTFSLVKRGALPKGEDELKDCGKKFEAICGAVAEWHEVDFESGEVGKEEVEAGEEGWDTAGSEEREGDSWFTEKEGASTTRAVSAPAGKTLRFMCVVHPEMQGKIEVEG